MSPARIRRLLQRINSLAEGSAGRNAAYNTLDTAALPILMLAATPFVLPRLGLEKYGIWMLANSIAATLSFFNVGLGDATVRYVSAYRSRGDHDAVLAVLRSTLVLYGLIGVALAVVLALGAGAIVEVLDVRPEARLATELALQVAGATLAVRTLELVFISVLRGIERYDLTAKVTIAEKVASVGLAVVIAWAGGGVVAILIATLIVTAIGLIVHAAITNYALKGLSFWRRVNWSSLREILGFGVFSWLQGLGGILFGHVDRVLVGALLGVRSLAFYTICTYLAMQVHLLTSAGFHFIFPALSRVAETKGKEALRDVYGDALRLSLATVAVLTGVLALLSKPILTAWLGGEFAAQAHVLLSLLALAYGFLTINVVPHNALLALGKVRFVAFVNLIGGGLTLAGILVLAPTLGLIGVGLANFLYGATVSANFGKVSRSLS